MRNGFTRLNPRRARCSLKANNLTGFTLIEVLLAVFIVTIGIGGVMAVCPLGVQTAKSAQMASVGSYLAQEKLEELLSKPYNDPALAPGSALEDYGVITGFNPYKRESRVSCVRPSDLAEVPCDYDLANDPTPMKKVQVEVFWRSFLLVAEKSVRLATLISNI